MTSTISPLPAPKWYHRVHRGLIERLPSKQSVAGSSHDMTKQIRAIFEKGVLRPEHPIDLPDGEQLQLIVVTRKRGPANSNAASALAEIAALPLEGETGPFSGADHDSVLYPKP